MTSPQKTFYERELDRISLEAGLQQYLYVLLRQSRAFMDQYHSRHIALRKIAGAAFLSRFHYVRTFRRVYGVTPRQYLRDLRISKAKELLKRGLAVTDVCLEVGYESLPTFSRVFKQATGHSPRNYQKQNFRNRG
jgi:AraC-like DNA-binding protein